MGFNIPAVGKQTTSETWVPRKMADSETATPQDDEQTTTMGDDKAVAEEKKSDDNGSVKVDVLTAAGLSTITVYISSVSLDTEVGNASKHYRVGPIGGPTLYLPCAQFLAAFDTEFITWPSLLHRHTTLRSGVFT